MTLSLGLFTQIPMIAYVLVLSLVLGVGLSVYLSTQRLKDKKLRFLTVLITQVIAVVAVLGLVFELQTTTTQPKVTYLITTGTTAPQLENIPSQQSVFVMQQAAESIKNKNLPNNTQQISSLAQLLAHVPNVEHLHILGSGLSSQQWQNLQLLMGHTFEKMPVTFSPSQLQLGLVDMKWDHSLAVGQFVEVTGQLQGTDNNQAADNIYQLTVLDPIGQSVDTLRLKTSEYFRFNFPAKSSGQWIYQLQLSLDTEDNLLANQPIAFSVYEPAPLKILIKQSAPSFETKQLKNWAAQFNNQVSVLTQISQDKDIRQNINLSAPELLQLTPPFSERALATFDWLVIDGRSLLALTTEQTSTLHMAIQNGLGVYIIADETLVKALPVSSLTWLSDIHIQPLDVANYSAKPIWTHSKIEQPIPLLKAGMESGSGLSLVKSHQDEILVSQQNIGLGRVALSLIDSTYGWQTSGMTAEYSHYWQSLIIALARPKQSAHWLTALPGSLSMVNKPEQRCLLGAVDTGKATINQSPEALNMTPNLIQIEQGCINLWASQKGWQHLLWSNTKDAAQTWFYTYDQHDWLVWQQAQNRQASEQVVNRQNIQPVAKPRIEPIDKKWFWWLLVISMSVLWLERKLY
jgi:hypothetical protein